MSQSTNAAANYAELATEATNMVVEAISSANERTLNYAKSIWEIVSRPIPAGQQQQNVRDGFERADQIVSLTVKELEHSLRKSTEFAEKMLAQNAKLQRQSIESLHNFACSTLTNVKQVVETAGERIDEFAKNVEKRAA